MHRSLAVALVATVCGCGSGSGHKDLTDCPLVSGKFKATSTLASTTGSCARAKAESVDSLTFKAGTYEFPISGVADCHTQQDDCSLTVKCSTPLLPTAHFSFNGTLSTDGTQLTGTAMFTGAYQGCTQVVYSVTAVAD